MSAIPADIAALADYERHAARILPEAVWRHVQDGVDQAPDRAAYDRLHLLPRRLADLRGGSTAIQLFGQVHAVPLLLAPVAYHKLAHPDGERATVRAAAALGVTMVVSTLSSVSLEEIAAAADGAVRELGRAPVPLWFQLYLQQDRANSLRLVRRAESAGYRAIVLTVDAAVKRAGFALPTGVEAANLRGIASTQQHATADGAILFGTPLADTAPRWEDLDWLRGQTTLPLLVKGIMAPDDARRAVAQGADGLIVSNHGGRVLPGLPAALDVVPLVRRAVGPTVPLLLDGAVRAGTDVVKALAAGADAAMVGRPQLHALAVAGLPGVAHMVHLLRAELELAMAQIGCRSPAEIGPEYLFRPA